MDFDRYSIREIGEALHKAKPKMAILERVSPIHGSSAAGTFKFGDAFGSARTMLELLAIPHDLVPPKTWQKYCAISVKAGLTGPQRKKALKEAIAKKCSSLFPGCDIRGPQGGLKDGRSDSLMLAHYCRQHFVNS